MEIAVLLLSLIYIAGCSAATIPTNEPETQSADDTSCVDPEYVTQIKYNMDPASTKVCYDGHITIEKSTDSGNATRVWIFPTKERVCPTKLDRSVTATIGDRSSCPWDDVISIDEHRIPRVIKMARCLCDPCVTKHGGDRVCDPVYYTMNVLRRKNCGPDGVATWVKDQLEVPVACTCAVPRGTSSTS